MIEGMRGKRAAVTGGAQGIGYAIAAKLLSQGAQVALWDQDEVLMAEAVAGLGDGARGVAVDVTDQETVAAAGAESPPQQKYQEQPAEQLAGEERHAEGEEEGYELS